MHSSSPRRSRRWLFSLVLLLIVIGVCWWLWPKVAERFAKPGASATATSGQSATRSRGGRGGAMGAARPGFGGSDLPVPVRVVPVITADFPVYYKALGTVTALNTVNVHSRVNGELVKVAFQEGQQVKAGDLLAEIDPRTYQIALQQAAGTLAENQALLKNAQADLARYKGLFAQDSIAKQTLDTQAALVTQYQGTLKTNEAAVNQAKLNLEFTKIRSPIAGRVGLRQVDIGNQISTGDTTALVVITQTHPLSVAFTLPEAALTAVITRYRTGEKLPTEAWDRADSAKLATGVLQSVDNQIDTTTGTLKFKARFENQDDSLFPNQFVNVRLLADTLPNAVLVPSAAIQFGTNGAFVYVVVDNDDAGKAGTKDSSQAGASVTGKQRHKNHATTDDKADANKAGDNKTADNAADSAKKPSKKVVVRLLKVGASDASNTVVQSGLVAGDQVVLEGTDRLRDGTGVDVVADSKDVPATPGEHLQGSNSTKADTDAE